MIAQRDVCGAYCSATTVRVVLAHLYCDGRSPVVGSGQESTPLLAAPFFFTSAEGESHGARRKWRAHPAGGSEAIHA